MSEIHHSLSFRSHFSLGFGLLSPSDGVQALAKAGMKTVAMVDTMTVSGMTEFFDEAKEQGVKSILGCRIRVVDDPTYRKPPRAKKWEVMDNREWFPKVYVNNDEGLKDLFGLLTLANSEEYFYYVPRVSFDDLLNALRQGNLSVSTGDFYSAFHHADYRERVEQLRLACSDAQTFIELVPVETPLFRQRNQAACALATELGVQSLVTYPVMYESGEDADALDALSAVTSNTKMDAPWRHIPYTRDFYVRTTTEFVDKAKARLPWYSDYKKLWLEGLTKGPATLERQCALEWHKRDVTLPVLVRDEFKTLVNEVKQGWKTRLLSPTMGYQPSAEQLPLYQERLKYELSVLRDMGFCRYFILVQYLVMWSKREGILVGPGRGSVGGSLVAFLLGITDVDPLRFGLIFERFINPDRLDLPDADLDFMSSRRHEVVAHLVERFGQDRVAGISNYSTLASASALREPARLSDLSAKELSATKLVPKVHGSSVSLDEAAEQVPELDTLKKTYPKLWTIATKLEGALRTFSQHAAGVVVAGEPIRNRAVIERRSGSSVVNWDKRVVEDWGLVKMDILGLSTLDIIRKALDLIQRYHAEELILTTLPLDDEKTLEAFSKGRTVGVFQFESPGMRKLLKDLAEEGRLTFDDLSAATALYRPGPMDSGLMDEFVAIKQGIREPYYEHENMRSALEETHGVIVYQEQVMKLAVDLAGFTFAESDKLRKAMGKKLPEEMAKFRDKWVAGCESHSGMTDKKAAELFDKVEAFAGYGFNKSHAVEYSVISYWTMWLKAHYPAEFYAAALSVTGEDNLSSLVADAEHHGLLVSPPDINRSEMDFAIGYDEARDKKILLTPFGRLKGLSEKTSQAILDAREGSPFKNFKDFLGRVEKRRCNKRHQEVLWKVGAFASIEPDEKDPLHPDRLKDQLALMPGLVNKSVTADRVIDTSATTKNKVISIIAETRACKGCDLSGGVHPTPRMGSKPKMMIVSDCPNWSEEQANKMLEGPASEYLRRSLKAAGLTVKDVYATALVKSPKSEKQLTNDQINGCTDYLKRELEILKPPVVVVLGGASARALVPGIKGGWSEIVGTTHYNAERDMTVVVGLNPGMIAFDPDKQEILDEVMKEAGKLVV